MKNKSYALLSVYSKEGIVELAHELIKLGYQIISTGGTAKVLTANNILLTPIEKITGNPESFDGRMKTISFQVESGIIYDRKNSSHIKQAKSLNVPKIDIVVCNLYPFEKAPSVENIDVGGPTMVRAAAKNWQNVYVVIDPKDYQALIFQLKSSKQSDDFRKNLAAKAFRHLSFYDAQVAKFFGEEMFPEELVIPGRKTINLRYGENPHQQGAVYFFPNTASPLKNLKKQWGRDLSLINVTDINAGIEAVRIFTEPAACVIKHNTPCGIALGRFPAQALDRAIESDPQSAFGGAIILNRAVDLKTAKIIGSFKEEKRGNIDILAAPEIKKDAFDYLSSVRKSMGIYSFGKIISYKRMNYKWIDGGFIAQTSDDNIDDSFSSWKVVTKIKPTKKQLEQMRIAWKFISKIRSNTIAVIDPLLPMTRGIGSGQTSRIGAAKIALAQAGSHVKNAILASDSFFPYDDTVKMAAQYGIGAIVQQGGSIRDKDSIRAADDAGIPMVFTGRRAFWH